MLSKTIDWALHAIIQAETVLIKIQNIANFREEAGDILARDYFAPGPHWGLRLKPHLGSRSALAMLPL
jgi:hypothetical protein